MTEPLLRVVRGNPDEFELAALTAVVAAAASTWAAVPREKPARTSWWGDRSMAVRRPLHPGEGAWRASALPR